MKILNKISIKNLKLNKKRTISTIIGIMLSVALICAVATLVTSFRETLIRNAINETGYYHLRLDNVSDENIKELRNNRDIKSIHIVNEIGYGNLENSKNQDKPYLKLNSMDESTFKNLSFNLISGRFPKNKNEIVISEHIIKNAKVDYKINDKIKIKIGDRKTLDGLNLYFSNSYNSENEKLVNEKEHEFTIVGIIKRPDNSFESYEDPGYTVITTEENMGAKCVYISLKNPKDHKTSIAQILGVKDIENIREKESNLRYEHYFINRELLRWEAFYFSDSTVKMLFAVSGVVIFIIIFTSVFCIRNSFAISTTEKIKMYGILASVGATKKQINKSVVFEALLLGIIGIPLGILLGILAVFVLIPIINMIAGDYFLGNIDGIVFKVSAIPVVISCILGFVTIYLSAISSAKKASRISPIDSLKNSSDIKIKKNKLKVPKIISKIFKTGGVLAYKNLKRSKKKYRTTVISLAVSVFVFITMNSFVTNMFGVTSRYYKEYEYNMYISNSRKTITSDQLEKIKHMDNIEDISILYESISYIKIYDISKVNEFKEPDMASSIDEEVVDGEVKKTVNLQIVGLDDKDFNNYTKKIGLDYNKVKDTGILCDEYKYYDSSDNKEKMERRYNYKDQDIISGTIDGRKFSIKIGKVSSSKPLGLGNAYTPNGYIIVNKDVYKDINFEIDNITIKSDNPDELENNIKQINDTVYVANYDKIAKEDKSMALVIKIFLYGFIAVITLIGVTNIFNTITSSMELRQKEFAMLKSIGMTKKEFNRMVNLETLFYCTKALIYGIISGIIGTFAIYKAFSVKISSQMYIPIKPIIVSVIFVFIIVYIIMNYSIRKINKQNTIETIRKENV